jgi:hypothetical protein
VTRRDYFFYSAMRAPQVPGTDVGRQQAANGLGTRPTTLRERLQLIFGDAAHLRLIPNAPRGVAAEVDMPAQR